MCDQKVLSNFADVCGGGGYADQGPAWYSHKTGLNVFLFFIVKDFTVFQTIIIDKWKVDMWAQAAFCFAIAELWIITRLSGVGRMGELLLYSDGFESQSFVTRITFLGTQLTLSCYLP